MENTQLFEWEGVCDASSQIKEVYQMAVMSSEKNSCAD